MEKNHLNCVNVGITIAEQPVLEGVNLSIESHDLLCIQGSNGSGKTTLLKALAGLIRPSVGQITWNGTDLQHATPPLAYVGHRNGLSKQFTVLENIEFIAKMYRNTELIEAAIHYFDLTPYLGMRVAQLSAGWQKKVALTRLILSPAKLWLLDEPFAHLDDGAMGLVESLIQTRKEQGGMVIFTTHGRIENENIKIYNINNIN